MNNTTVRVLQGVLVLVLLAGSLGMGGCQTVRNIIAPDPLKDSVIKADLIVLGTITDKKYEVVDVGLNTPGVTPGAYTLFTLSVEKVIKGNPDTKEVLIRVEGGPIGELYQVPTGAYFAISDRVLALLDLKEGNVYNRVGIAWYESPATGFTTTASLSDITGRIIQIMMANKIPISLPESEWPPLPVPIPWSPSPRGKPL